MQGFARRDTSAWASALASPARTFIVCHCCETPGALFWHTGEGIVRQRPMSPAPQDPLPCVGALTLALGGLERQCGKFLKRVERARARDVQGGLCRPA